MQSNAISKFSEDTTNSYNYNLNIYTPKLAILDVKSVDYTANVINKVESNNNDIE